MANNKQTIKNVFLNKHTKVWFFGSNINIVWFGLKLKNNLVDCIEKAIIQDTNVFV